VRLELERRDDSEVAARAAYGPEEVLVLGCARLSQLTVCGDDVDRAEAVDREPVLAAQVADPSVQGQAGDSGRRDDPAGHGESEELRLPIRLAPGRASLCPHRLRRRIDVDAAHLREIDHQAAVVDCVAGDVVAAALDRDEQVLLAREGDGVDDIGCAAALHDQRRSTVDQPVPERAGIVVARIAGSQNRSAQSVLEDLGRFRVECGFSRRLACHRFLLSVSAREDARTNEDVKAD